MGKVNAVNLLDTGRSSRRVRGRSAARARRLYVFGGLLLILAGLGLALIAGQQFWGTASEAHQAQQDLTTQFRERQAQAADSATTSSSLSTGAVPVDAEPATTVPEEPTPTTIDEGELPRWDNPVITPSDRSIPELPPVETTALQSEPALAEGDVLGRIVIEDIGLDWMVVEGVRGSDLSRGPGHGPWSAIPGQPGNAVISGHRTTYGAPFNRLDELEPGDLITVETLIGTHTYEVVGTVIVQPQDVWTIERMQGAWLTLTTCHPEYWSSQRLVVFSRLTDGPNAEAIAELFPSDYSLPVAPGSQEGTDAVSPLPAPLRD